MAPMAPRWGPPMGPHAPGPPMGPPWTFAGHKSSSYSSYEDVIDTNRILIQKSTILKGQAIKISCLRQVYKQNTCYKIFQIYFLIH